MAPQASPAPRRVLVVGGGGRDMGGRQGGIALGGIGLVARQGPELGTGVFRPLNIGHLGVDHAPAILVDGRDTPRIDGPFNRHRRNTAAASVFSLGDKDYRHLLSPCFLKI
jgi:hypothetical protein